MIKLNDIKSPALRRRIEDALHNAEMIKHELQNVVTVKTPVKKRIRQRSKPALNKLEQEALDTLHSRFPFSTFRPHCLNLEIANGTWLCPDIVEFAAEPPLRIYEVKGKQAWEDSIIKLKVAARTWKEFHWWLMWKDDLAWHSQRVLP